MAITDKNRKKTDKKLYDTPQSYHLQCLDVVMTTCQYGIYIGYMPHY